MIHVCSWPEKKSWSVPLTFQTAGFHTLGCDPKIWLQTSCNKLREYEGKSRLREKTKIFDQKNEIEAWKTREKKENL